MFNVQCSIVHDKAPKERHIYSPGCQPRVGKEIRNHSPATTKCIYENEPLARGGGQGVGEVI